MTGPGYPMETTEYFHPTAAFSTALTIFFAVISGPEGILTGFFCPVASTLMCVPPTSITRIDCLCFVIRFPQRPKLERATVDNHMKAAEESKATRPKVAQKLSLIRRRRVMCPVFNVAHPKPMRAAGLSLGLFTPAGSAVRYPGRRKLLGEPLQLEMRRRR